MEVVGRGGSLGRPAGVAVSAGRAACRPGAASSRGSGWFRCCGRFCRQPAMSGRGRCGAPFCCPISAECCGTCGNCYWVRDTMMHYGDMPPVAPTLLLLGFSLVLGLYFGFFGLGVVLVRRATGSDAVALAAAPFLWAALGSGGRAHHQRSLGSAWLLAGGQRARESACAVDRRLRDQLCAGRGECAACGGAGLDWRAQDERLATRRCAAALLLLGGAGRGNLSAPPKLRPRATAVLVQPNLDVGADNIWAGAEWDRHIADSRSWPASNARPTSPGFRRPARRRARSSARRIPRIPIWWSGRSRPRRSSRRIRRFQQALAAIARSRACAAGGGQYRHGFLAEEQRLARLQLGAGCQRGWRARGPLRQDSPGSLRRVRSLPAICCSLPTSSPGRFRDSRAATSARFSRLECGHRYGVFICYESVFADEVRQFARTRRRGAGEHQRRRLVRRHQRSLAAPEHGAHEGHRKPPLDSARHQQRRHGGHRSLWPRAAEHSAPRRWTRCRRSTASATTDLLHRAWRRVCVGCVPYLDWGLWAGLRSAGHRASEFKSKSGHKSKTCR